MMKTRKLAAGAVAAMAAGALLTSVAFAGSDGTMANDAADNGGSAAANLAQTTTATGEAKGDAISAAAKAMTSTDVDENTTASNDEDTNASSSSDAHGDAVSKLATTTTLTGEAKGDAISALASSTGKSHRSSH